MYYIKKNQRLKSPIEAYTTQEEKKYGNIKKIEIHRNFIIYGWIFFILLSLIKIFKVF